MGRLRGFLLKHRVRTLFRRVFRRPFSYRRLNPPQNRRVKPFSKLMSWTKRLRSKAKAKVSKNHEPGSGYNYNRVGQEEPDLVPKGHMAVYVGQKDGDCRRILVPVVYFNHPLFGDLLKESENEYGFDHPGGITLPCRVSEFERVQTRIKTGRCKGMFKKWKRSKSKWVDGLFSTT